jgi:hypothetical protein
MRNRISRRAFPLIAIAGLMLTTACGGLVDLMRLSSGINHDFGQNSVNLSNGHLLTVTMKNSTAAGRPDEARTARRVAEYVRDHYPGFERLQYVVVAFEQTRQTGPVGYTAGQGSYTFSPGQLGEPHR